MSNGDASSGRSRRTPVLTKIVFVHFAALVVFSSWAFGGQSPWARHVIAWWGTAGMALFLWASAVHRPSDGKLHPAIRLLWPLWLFDLLVITSCFNPSFREAMVAGQPSLVLADPKPWLPTAARPLLAARELWQFNGLVLSSFNLLLVLHRRRQVRAMLFVLAGNAVVLAVFGTFQKLAGAKGLWFGAVPSPNPRFFSTFIYHNHWGAFTLLNTAACVALLFHYHRRGGHRDIWHSPVLLGAVATLLLALSVPLSASRSCTALTALLLGGALTHFLLRIIRRRRESRQSAALPVTAIVLAAVLAVAAIGWLGRDVIADRAYQTSAQLAKLGSGDPLTSRLTLYRDTWRMAAEKPWFGWGLESYAHVFRIFNTQRAVESWVWIPFYAEAHNDWLQALAEVGFVGTSLLALLVLLPLASVRWRRVASVIPRYLLAGCGLVLLYAWLEFPFANPAVMLSFCATFCCALRYAALDLRAQQENPR
ncbi:MAG TPA: O-antigen ligase family protein [Lacunisphaera sp.]|nr:O-antigen ligase family protein [Lacunisphaera sp.]